MGLMDKFTGKVSETLGNRQAKKQEGIFQDMMMNMSNLRSYRIEDFLTSNKDALAKSGADGWRGKMPWSQSQKEGVEDLKKCIKLFESIPPEMRRSKKIYAADAREIADKNGVDYEEMRVMLHKLKMSQQMHKLLRTRAKAGAPLPQNQEELQFLMHEYPPKLTPRERNKEMWKSLKTAYNRQGQQDSQGAPKN